MLASVRLCFCLIVVAVCVASPPGDKKLRNVIITSFGELPYDPMESGYYQGEVLPVNFEDDIKQETMDVALRTRILVEDPNEKKALEENRNISPEFEEASTNGQVRYDRGSGGEFHSPKRQYKGKVYQDTLNQHPQRNFDYAYRQARNYNKPSTPNSNGYNINTEYYGDLGEGWNLQDAEEILRGRNYNILVQTPNSYPKNPVPPPRETPPPFFVSGPPHPVFYPFPSFGYKPRPLPGFGQYKSEDTSSAEDRRSTKRQDTAYTQDMERRTRGRDLPFTQYSEEYLRGA